MPNFCIKRNIAGTNYLNWRIYEVLFSFSFSTWYVLYIHSSVHSANTWGRTNKNQNYHLEGRSLVVQASPARWVFEEPSVSVNQLALWDSVFSFSTLFFEDSLNALVHFMMGDLQVHLPTPLSVQQFWPTIAWPRAPASLFNESYPKRHFLFPHEISPQRERFSWCGRSKTKMGEALKGIKID